MVKELLERARAEHVPVEGKYPSRPESSLSLNKLLHEGKIPMSFESAKLYQMNDGKRGYYYYDEADVREMTVDEILEKNYLVESGILKGAGGGANKKAPKTFDFSVLTPDYKSKPVLAMDTESTGFSSKWDDIIQISIVGCQGLEFDSYVKPVHKKTWPKAEAINHISPDMVKDAPSYYEIKAKVQKYFDKAAIIVGHNVSFDIRMIEGLWGVKIDKSKVIDTMDLFECLYPEVVEAENKKLCTVVATVASDETKTEFASGAHNSLYDTRATYEVFVKMADKYLAKTK